MEARGRETADAAPAGGVRARLRLLGGAELEGPLRLRFLPSGAFGCSPTWRCAATG